MVAKENLRQASEDLTKQLELVYRKAKELVAKKSLASAWIKDGMTQIKLTAKGKTLKVRSMQDLERVMSEAQMETAKDSAAKGPDQQTAKATDSKDKPIAIDRTQLTFDSPDVIK